MHSELAFEGKKIWTGAFGLMTKGGQAQTTASIQWQEAKEEKHKALLLLVHQYEGFSCSVIETMVSAGTNKR